MDIGELIFDGPAAAPLTLALAHGAGAPMDSDFMAAFAAGLGQRGLRVARFEFPYMARRRREGGKRPPDREPVLRAAWQAVIERLAAEGPLAIGGKSMGGRMASLVAADAPAGPSAPVALVCFGYPFHPPGKPERLRTAHLGNIATPTLIVQGTRDPFGTREEVGGYALSRAVELSWAEDGNHDLAPRKASGRTSAQNWEQAMDVAAAFLHARVPAETLG